jgi:hypothetical protein
MPRVVLLKLDLMWAALGLLPSDADAGPTITSRAGRRPGTGDTDGWSRNCAVLRCAP